MLRIKKQRRIFWLLMILFMNSEFIACSPKTTCPAYMNGAVTGTSGSSSKGKPLWPKNMKKQKN
ncbi:MAG: hypothetical protein WCI97_03520 [Bacteroidota bacterium]